MFTVELVPVPPQLTPASRVLEPIPRAMLCPARMTIPVDGVTVVALEVDRAIATWHGPKFVTIHVVSDAGVPGRAMLELVAPNELPTAASRVKNGSAFSCAAMIYFLPLLLRIAAA
jgi:hypothetical protein